MTTKAQQRVEESHKHAVSTIEADIEAIGRLLAPYIHGQDSAKSATFRNTACDVIRHVLQIKNEGRVACKLGRMIAVAQERKTIATTR